MRVQARYVVLCLLACALGACEVGSADRRGHARDGAATTDAVPAADTAPAPDTAVASPSGVTCGGAVPLTPGVTLRGQEAPTTGTPSTQCRPSDAPQRFYAFTLPPDQRAVITVTPAEGSRVVARVLRGCDATECLTDDESTAPGAPVRLVVNNPGAETLQKTLTVSGPTASRPGRFDVSLRLEPTTPGPVACALPLAGALRLPMDTVTGTLAMTDGRTSITCRATPGHEDIYSLHVAERATVEIVADCGSRGCGVAVRRACADPATEVACNSTPRAGPGPEFGEVRATLDPGDYFVLVDATNFNTSSSGNYTLTLRPFDAAPNFTCETATPVVNGTVLRDQHLGRGGSPDLTCGGDSTPSGDTRSLGEVLYYAADVPPGSTLVAETQNAVVPSGIRFIARVGCGSANCLSGPGITPLQYTNTGAVTQRVVFGVTLNSPLMGADGVFDLAVQILPRASNAACASATRVVDGARFETVRTPLGGAPIAACGRATDRPVLYYAASVPSLHRLQVTARELLDRCNAVVRFLDGCDAASCLNPAGSNEYVNTGTAPREVVVAVSCGLVSSTPVDLSFEIDPVDLGPAPANSTCAAATPVTHLTSITEASAIGFAPGATCLASTTGRSLYYSATIPAGHTLQAAVLAVRPAGGLDPSIRLADSCGDVACVATADARGLGGDETLTFANGGAMAREVRFAVSNAGLFDLRVFITPTLGSGRVVHVSTGQFHSCALLDDATVSCGGTSMNGELGNGSVSSQWVPAAVEGLTRVAQVDVGGSHSCARMADGTVQCWGFNGYGALGDGTDTSRSRPTPVAGLAGVTQIALGNSHSCALRHDGTAACWGWNGFGQLGGASDALCFGFEPCALAPVAVPGLSGVAQLAAGITHTCARLGDGTVRCWGFNTNGELGSGGPSGVSGPVAVAGLSGVTQVAVGSGHSCARLSDGTVHCWGDGYYGQLGFSASDLCGNGDRRCAHTPGVVPGLSGVAEIALGTASTCARLDDGRVLCWGRNESGELGDGTTIARMSPAPVVGVSGATAIDMGFYSSGCAVLVDRSVRCWGANYFGRLGDGTTIDHPVAAPSLF